MSFTSRYTGTLVMIGGGLLILLGISALLGGNYLFTLLLVAAGVLLLQYGKRLGKDIQYKLDNPVTAALPSIQDQSMLNALAERPYNSFDYQLGDLQVGSVFDFQGKTWRVDKVRRIFWEEAGGQAKRTVSKDLLITNLDEENNVHLRVFKNNRNPLVPVLTPVNIFSVDENMERYIGENGFDPPPVLQYRDEKYYRESPKKGLDVRGDNTFQTFYSFDYYNENRDKALIIDYWNDKSIEAFSGKVVHDESFGSLLPPPQN